MTETPFKANINGKGCTLVVRDDSITMVFNGGPGPLAVRRSDIRCIQHRGKELHMDAEQDGRMIRYRITASGAKRIFEIIISDRGWTASHRAAVGAV